MNLLKVRERLHATLKKNQLSLKNPRKAPCSILFITPAPCFKLTVKVISAMQHPATAASPHAAGFSRFVQLPPSPTADFQNMLSSEKRCSSRSAMCTAFGTPEHESVRKAFTYSDCFHTVFS